LLERRELSLRRAVTIPGIQRLVNPGGPPDITFGWNGCGACIEEAGNMNKWETQYRSQGLRQLSALHSDIQTPNFGPATTFGPATESTAQDWIKTYGIKYDVVIDPTDQLNNGTKPTFDPHSWIIDTKTMKIIHAIPGAPGSLLPYGLVSLRSLGQQDALRCLGDEYDDPAIQNSVQGLELRFGVVGGLGHVRGSCLPSAVLAWTPPGEAFCEPRSRACWPSGRGGIVGTTREG
jgi:hypothetical protein